MNDAIHRVPGAPITSLLPDGGNGRRCAVPGGARGAVRLFLGGALLVLGLAAAPAQAQPQSAEADEGEAVREILIRLEAGQAALESKVDNNFALTNARFETLTTLMFAGLGFLGLLFTYLMYQLHVLNQKVDGMQQMLMQHVMAQQEQMARQLEESQRRTAGGRGAHRYETGPEREKADYDAVAEPGGKGGKAGGAK